jgi:excisionase family DNA binding protein
MTVVLLTPKEVAAILRVDKSWVYRAAREGSLPAVKLGHYVRFEERVLDEWIRNGGARGATVDGNRAGAALTTPPTAQEG